MNKKFILTSILTLTFAMPAMAEITSGATCDTTNLGQSENNSTANVEADWTANTINIDWYANADDDTPYASTTCTYDDTITLPQTTPTKTGYTFAGWQLVEEPLSCADYSSQQQCMSGDNHCVWDNGTCYEPGDFCRSATTESECINNSNTLYPLFPDQPLFRGCTWQQQCGRCCGNGQSCCSMLLQ